MLASGLTYEPDALANKDFRYLTKTSLRSCGQALHSYPSDWGYKL